MQHVTQAQERNLMQMKEEVSSMVSNFSKLIKTSKVGHTEQVAAYQGDSETTERPVPIETQSYMDLRVSVPIQNFASSIAANGLVRSSESLLSLINVLKINRVLDDPARIQTDKKRLSRVFEAQKEENLAQLGQLEAEVAEAIGILENHYYSSRVCPSPHLKNGAK